MKELTLLKLFLTKDVYERYQAYVKLEGLTDEVKLIFNDLGQYYDQFGQSEVDLEKFVTWFQQVQHPAMNETVRQLYNKLFTNLNATPIEPGDKFVESILQHFQSENYKERIRNELARKDWSIENIMGILDEYQKSTIAEEDEIDFEVNDPEVFLHELDRSNGLTWRLNCLQQTLGSLIPGELGVFAAPVNGGKSSLMASEVVNFAGQLTEGTVLWFTTEQTAKQVLSRLWGLVLDTTADELKATRKADKERYKAFMNGDINRIRVFNGFGYSTTKIANKIKKYSPKLVVIDMLDHIRLVGVPQSYDWGYSKQLYETIRQLNHTCPIIGTTQCDAQTEGVYGPNARDPHKPGDKWFIRYISMKMLEGSKVGKPGAADFIVTLGRDDRYPSTRYISVVKSKTNKLIESEVAFDAARALFTDFTF